MLGNRAQANVGVSVVIPTIGRPELSRAVRSARQQVGGIDVEVIVVNDNADENVTAGADADLTVWTGGGRGGGYARNCGVNASQGRFIAFLDDDDEWIESKLQDQIALINRMPRPDLAVVSGRHMHVAPGAVTGSRTGPDALIEPTQTVEDYLFRRRKPSVGRAAMYTSTLMCERSLAITVPWREDLRRHQDWDWLVRLGRRDGVMFAHCPSVVARIQTGSSNSISAGSNWAASLAWADETLEDNRVYVDFVVGQSLRYALTGRSGQGVAAVMKSVVRRRRLPSVGPSILGLAGLVPRPRLERLMTRDAASSPRSM